MGDRDLTSEDVRYWFLNAGDGILKDFLDNGLESLIFDLEQDDFFGTEGFNRRYG